MIRKLLVANRGEIAVRVFRTAQELGIKTVAIFSEADENSLHRSLADESVCVGEPEPAQSYLNVERILSAARETGADSIHPGYGFLSERSSFARQCREAGLTFVGPSPEAMERLGAKIDAKKLAVECKVPVTPGYFEEGATAAQLREAAEKIGFPVMLKASAGGGGRGMRVVREPSEFDHELALASEEALKAFGDGAMMVEKLIDRPRHIEIQVLADQHGNVACLFERECSLQRRHQKVIEEAPSPVMTDELWSRMREAARRLVAAAGYVGAGTVEFMVDDLSREFFFLEVNARLQVEHPVTEAVTGIDLVEWQIRVAANEALRLPAGLLEGDRSSIKGHAIEARVVAEDPARGYLPSVGPILGMVVPDGPGVRFDTGFRTGSEVTRHYDSLLGKAIASGQDRDHAVRKLRRALEDTHIIGIQTNIAYLLDVLSHPGFNSGAFDTGFLAREFGEWQPSSSLPEALGNLISVAVSRNGTGTQTAQTNSSAWTLGDDFRIARPRT